MGRSEPDFSGLNPQEQVYFRRQLRAGQRFPALAPHFLRYMGRVNRLAFRFSGGRVGGTLLGRSVGLLTTTGRRSGRSRTTPVVYFEDGLRYLVVASNGGFDRPPGWQLNLRANPEAGFRTRAGTEHLVARELTDSERQQVWPRLLAHNPLRGAYQSLTARQFAVFALERAAQQTHPPASEEA